MDKMNFLFMLLIGFSAVFSNISAADYGRDFAAANTKYSDGLFKDAAIMYEEIIDGGVENGKIWFNLGNSYYKQGNVLNAIYAYEKSLRFMPGDQDLRKNLEICRLNLKDKVESKVVLPVWVWISEMRDAHNLYQNLSFSVICLFVLSVLLSFSFFYKSLFSLKLIRVLMIFLLLCALTGGYFGYTQYTEYFGKHALVASEEVSVKSSPDENSNGVELFRLHLGLKLMVEKELGEWVKIAVDSEKKGWLKKEELLLLD